MHHRFVCFGLLLMGAWFLVGCRRGRSTVLEDTSCMPPCWNMITPGQSTEQDVLSRLSILPEVDPSSIRNNVVDSQRSNIFWEFTSDVADSAGRIHFHRDQVIIIKLDTRGSLTFDEAVQELGEPEQVSAICSMVETRLLDINLLYPSKGMVINHYDDYWRKSALAEIEPNGRVNEVIYFQSELYEELLSSGRLILEEYATIQSSLTPWQGFGPVTYAGNC